MRRKTTVTVPVEDVMNEDAALFEKFMKLGRNHTQIFFHRLVYGREEHAISVSDALALAYLHGVYHGWETKERHDARQIGPQVY